MSLPERKHPAKGVVDDDRLPTVIFLTVSGGPYGLEVLYSSIGVQGALLLLLITPLLWDIPTILTVLELNGMMPVTGVTLPFVSSGGSSLIASFMSLGLLVNIGQKRPIVMGQKFFEFDE